MSFKDRISRISHRHHDRIGTLVRLETQVETGEQDDHGHDLTDTYSVETEAELVYRRQPVFDQAVTGVDADISTVVFIRDDVEIPLSGTETADSSEATRVHLLDDTPGTVDTLLVFNSWNEQNGKIRLHCVNFDG
jgi:hypothetical protein